MAIRQIPRWVQRTTSDMLMVIGAMAFHMRKYRWKGEVAASARVVMEVGRIVQEDGWDREGRRGSMKE